ncbi:hypothetical protein C8R46DRAFT_1045508 [Mycena filopes]|nr:hypothetical protein C8R46DRAFT_1045508 [Mycena filopes]
MPIQYYDPDWFNNRPPQSRAKVAPDLIVVFPPGSTDFFSKRGDNRLTTEELTEKYGPAVFADYDLDFGNDEAEGADARDGAEGADAGDGDDEGEGDSLGSEDSDEDAETSEAGSVADFLDDAGASDGQQDAAYEDEDANMYDEDEDEDEDDLGHEQEGAQTEYDHNMEEIFDGEDDDP